MKTTSFPNARHFGRILKLGLLLGAIVADVCGAGAPARYLGPCALVVSKNSDTLFVACADARQVVWVALPRGEVVRRVAVPGRPTGLALTPDQRALVVTCESPNGTVLLLDTATGRILTRLRTGHGATGPAVSPDGRRLYVCNRFDGDVSVIDPAEGVQIARIPAVREPVAAAVTPDGRTILVANHLPNMRTNVTPLEDVAPQVTVFQAAELRPAAISLPSGAQSLRDVSISPSGRYAFVTHLQSNFQEIPFRLHMGWVNTNVVSIIDISRRKVVATIGLDELDQGAANPWGVACTSDGRWLCVAASGTHELCVIRQSVVLSDEARRTMSPMMGVWPIYIGLGGSMWQRIPLPGKGPRGLAATDRRVYVAQYFSDSVAVVELDETQPARVRTIALGPAPVLTPERRGELLFHDATICFQTWQSCASCHPDARSDALSWDLMNDGQGNPKNTKSLLLTHLTPPAMAEGVRETAEHAVRSGIRNILFADDWKKYAPAIDAYLRSLRPVPSPYLIDGQPSPAAVRGRALFHSRRINCARCHPAPLYTDLQSHRVGTRNELDRTDRFDTPTLIEVWRTAPYLHDGRYTTVRQLLVEGRHGLKGDRKKLSDVEIDDLVRFVLSL